MVCRDLMRKDSTDWRILKDQMNFFFSDVKLLHILNQCDLKLQLVENLLPEKLIILKSVSEKWG